MEITPQQQLKELAQLIVDTRAAQNQYFKGGRTRTDLEYSKAKEKELDQAAHEILNPTIKNQQSLF